MLDKHFGLVQATIEPINKVGYLHLQHPGDVPRGVARQSERLGELVLDFDADGRLHGIEFLDLKQFPKLTSLPTDSVDLTIAELCRQLATAIHALDIETLREYHELSFLDPPSYHDEKATDDLWECGMCTEKFWERADTVLGKKPL